MVDTEQETRIEDNLEDDEDIIPFKFSLAVSRIDFPVDGIVKRLRDGDIFIPSFEVIHKSIPQAFKLKKVLNVAVFEAVMVGIAQRLEKGDIQNIEGLKQRYQNLLSDENFLAVVTTRSSNKKENLMQRLTLAVDAFAELE